MADNQHLKQLYAKLNTNPNTLPNNLNSWLAYSTSPNVDYGWFNRTFNKDMINQIDRNDYNLRQRLFEGLPLDNRLNIYNDYMMNDNGYMYEGYIGDGMSVDDYKNQVIADPEMYDLYVKYYLSNAK